MLRVICVTIKQSYNRGCTQQRARPSRFGRGGGNLGRKPGCRASLSSERLRSGYVMPLALVRGIKEAEPHLAKQLPYSARNRKGPWFYLKAACYPSPNSAAGETESGLRPYERRALSISAPSNEHNAVRMSWMPRALRLQFLGRDVMLPGECDGE